MKQILSIAAIIMLNSAAMAQAGKVTSAYNFLSSYNQYKDANDLREAADYIEPATTNEKTMASAKTWYYRGLIYHAIFQDSSTKAKNIVAEPLNLTMESYIKTVELDAKKEYLKDVTGRLYVAANQFYNLGIEQYNVKKNNLKALEYFENVLKINALPVFANATGSPEFPYYGFLDTNATNLAAVAAYDLKDYDRAVKYFQLMIDKGYRGGRPYSNLAQVLKSQGNTDKMLEVIKKGREKYPEDASLIIEELNYYLATGKDKEAEANLQLAIQKDPNNHQLHFALGSIYDKLSSPDDKAVKKPSKEEYRALRDKAEISYKKALQIDPNYFNAVYNLGALYFNEAGDTFKALADIKDDATYEKEKKRADELLKKALPYLEKAHQLDPKDKNTLISLKELYYRNGEEDKYADIVNKLKGM